MPDKVRHPVLLWSCAVRTQNCRVSSAMDASGKSASADCDFTVVTGFSRLGSASLDYACARCGPCEQDRQMLVKTSNDLCWISMPAKRNMQGSVARSWRQR
jgi:hypothetical protein